MSNPCLIALPPSRDNVRYQVKPKIRLEDLSSLLSHSLLERRVNCPKTVVFVRQYSDCSNLYLMIRNKMGSNFTEPPGYPDHAKFRLAEMYSRVATNEKKEKILSTFLCSNSLLRLVITTTSFSMGVDCPDITTIMHWGAPSTLEEYVQETRRAGCDGSQSEAIFFHGKGGKYASIEVLNYRDNEKTCRRRLLYKGFLKYYEKDIKISGCKCCDVCANDCKCGECSIPTCDIPDKVEREDGEEFRRKLQRYLSKLRVIPVKMATNYGSKLKY